MTASTPLPGSAAAPPPRSEVEGLEVGRRLGLDAPAMVVLPTGDGWHPSEVVEAAWDRIRALPTDRVVVKAQVPGLVHKTEAGAIRVVSKDAQAIIDTLSTMVSRGLPGDPVGFLVQAFLPHDSGMAGEVLLSARRDREFGWAVTLGPGGTLTEFWAEGLGADGGPIHLSPGAFDREWTARALRFRPWVRLLTEGVRGQGGSVALETLLDLLATLSERLIEDSELRRSGLIEAEFNPVAFPDGVPTALDAVVRYEDPHSGSLRPGVPGELEPARDLSPFLSPERIAIAGVSGRGMNPGRIILRNTLAEGFPAERLRVVKPGGGTVDGCACVDSPMEAGRPVDLLVLAIPADGATEAVEAACRDGTARGIVLIPGGLGETARSEDRVVAIRHALELAHRTRGWAPAINGGNCLGVRSKDGPVDTLFIPRHKLPTPDRPVDPVAIVSQSGAFAVARVSSLGAINPRVVATVGNQLDVTMGEYAEVLAADPNIEVIAAYVEGFEDGDGLRFLEAVRGARARGKCVVLYRAGRSRSGKEASASHTASIAGEDDLTRALASASGALIAESIGEFDDLVRLSVALRDRPVAGQGLAAVSNAGFECVALADHCEPLHLTPLGPETVERVSRALEVAGVVGITRATNPMDLTPMTGAGGFCEVVEAMLQDPSVAAGVVGCVPLTGAIETLEASDGHTEDLTRSDGLAARLGALWARTTRPWVMVVDSGSRYDPFARALSDSGLPVFRHADRAVQALARYLVWRRAGN